MKHSNLLLLLLCMLPFFAEAQHRADRQTLSDDKSFSMILLGDPQGYVKYAVNQPILELCTAWIADNVDNLHIRAVLCTGDLVEQNENAVPDSRMLDQTSREMWQASSKAFERLDNRIPYIVSCGNHDYGYKRSENGITNFPDYFPIERNSAWRGCCVATFPNRNCRASLENAAFGVPTTPTGANSSSSRRSSIPATRFSAGSGSSSPAKRMPITGLSS